MGGKGADRGLRPRARDRKALDLDSGDRLIDLKPLKLAARVLPISSALRSLVLEEPDEIPMSEYCVKITVWFRLLRPAERG